MKKLKDVVLIAFLIAGFSTYGYAQNGKGCNNGDGQDYKQQRKTNIEKLNLSDEQEADFKEINKRYAEKSAKLRNERDEEIKKILTEEQYETYVELRKERGKRSSMNRQKMECADRLNLTEEQQSKFREINRKYGQMAKEVRENGKSWEENKKEFEKIREGKDGEMKSLLSEEQYEIYLETHKDCPPGKMGYGKNKQKGKTN